MKTRNTKEPPDLMTKNPENWKWGVFYVNPSDPRMVVPKRTGLGVTINCASPKAWLLFAGIILFIVAMGYFL